MKSRGAFAPIQVGIEATTRDLQSLALPVSYCISADRRDLSRIPFKTARLESDSRFTLEGSERRKSFEAFDRPKRSRNSRPS